jgi:hypothetical protein
VQRLGFTAAWLGFSDGVMIMVRDLTELLGRAACFDGAALVLGTGQREHGIAAAVQVEIKEL